MKNNLKLLSILLSLFLVWGLNCNTTEPPVNNETLALSLADVSCTEVWIELKTNGLTLPANINLLKDNSVAQTINLNSSDTTIYIDSLLPNKSYWFQAKLGQGVLSTSSNKLTIQTFDTTSNSFIWETYAVGDPGSGNSVIYDAAIVDGNDMWTVGEIYKNDSTGQPDPIRYNAVHWNGSNWTVIRVPYNYQGQPYYNPIQAIFAFGVNDIWFAGNGVLHWDGSQYNPVPLPSNVWGQDQINKIWGISDNDIYIVGNGGNIAHYSGSTWQKISSGTNIRLNDIYGSADGKYIWITGYDSGTGETVLLQYNGSNIKTIYEASPSNPSWSQFSDTQISGIVTSVWSGVQNTHIWLATSAGFYFAPYNTSGEASLNYKFSFPIGVINNIRGGEPNNLIAVGDYNTVFHYNGVSWVLELIDFGNGKILRSCAVKGKDVIIVGGSAAIIIKGELIN